MTIGLGAAEADEEVPSSVTDVTTNSHKPNSNREPRKLTSKLSGTMKIQLSELERRK